MSDGTFEKVGSSEEQMYGPRKILVCGYPASEQEVFLNMLAERKLNDIPVVFVAEDSADKVLAAILELPDGSGAGSDSGLHRAAILSGLTEMELHQVMQGHKTLGLPKQLWAALTPVSEQWTMKTLLDEVAAESRAFHAKKG